MFASLFFVSFVSFVSVMGADINISVGKGLMFNPSSVDASVGDTIIWTFQGSHSVSEGLECVPNGFDSNVQNTGTFKYIISQERLNTTINYFCKVQSHCSEGMTGKINVKVQSQVPEQKPIPTNNENKISFNYILNLIILLL